MEFQLTSVHYSDPFWIAIAFACGLAVRSTGLPPLVGFLSAGFILNLAGAESGEFLESMADMGITLLLFTIGLKLKLKSLLKPEVWGVATLHMILTTLLIAITIWLLSAFGLSLLSNLDFETALLVGFAMSFSSTVFVVKVLDELGATSARHGTTAIGVLVVQDIAAVVFIALSLGKVPSPIAILLLGLIPLRYLIYWILDRVGHGELLILFGFTLALLGAEIFELVDIKADVGALVFGMLLANHRRAGELSKALFGFKELFLVGFFLGVGMTAVPGWIEVMIALLFMVFLPIKMALFFGLFSRFRLRTSTSWRTASNLANYSEFGLIVMALAVASGWLNEQWLAIFAATLSISLILSAPLINARDRIYQSWRSQLKRYEHPLRLEGEENFELAHIKVVVFGMGRMGSAAYQAIESDYHGHLVGIDADAEKVKQLKEGGRNVVTGDATNPDFWTRAPELVEGLEWVLLTLPNYRASISAAIRLREMGYSGHIAATSKFPDHEQAMKNAGVDHTFNIYTEAGLGFANELRGFVDR